MNRREIIETLKDMLDVTGLGHCSNQPECIAINAAIDAINQFAEDNNVLCKQPDPITGLAPCGCGGVVEQEDFHDGFFPHSRVTCRGCWTETTRCRCTTEEAHEMARIGWNASRGYTAPPPSGAIGPGTGEMAPNGEEGAGE